MCSALELGSHPRSHKPCTTGGRWTLCPSPSAVGSPAGRSWSSSKDRRWWSSLTWASTEPWENLVATAGPQTWGHTCTPAYFPRQIQSLYPCWNPAPRSSWWWQLSWGSCATNRCSGSVDHLTRLQQPAHAHQARGSKRSLKLVLEPEAAASVRCGFTPGTDERRGVCWSTGRCFLLGSILHGCANATGSRCNCLPPLKLHIQLVEMRPPCRPRGRLQIDSC